MVPACDFCKGAVREPVVAIAGGVSIICYALSRSNFVLALHCFRRERANVSKQVVQQTGGIEVVRRCDGEIKRNEGVPDILIDHP